MKAPETAEEWIEGVLSGNRTILARTITLIESKKREHRELSQEVLAGLLPHTGNAHRIGITGVPGVGKSTFIDQFGINLTSEGLSVAVLAVDPTSSRTGGSILGDKTRMARLAVDDQAFIRPSPAGETLGGVTRATRETMLVCEAAGFDVILVETVGVGQSETVVADMVDFFLVLMLAGAGDDLQGIKKGILELADLIAINKAEGDNFDRAKRAAADYKAALHLMAPSSPTWSTPVMLCSGLHNEGLVELWEQITTHRDKLTASGELPAKRSKQQVRWMWSMLDDRLRDDIRSTPGLAALMSTVEHEVQAGNITAPMAVDQLWDGYVASR